MGEEILVVKKSVLFKEKLFEGFLPVSQYDYLSLILKNYEYIIRTAELEENEEYQQPIPYVWLINSKENKIFLYKRSKTGNEGRLYGKYSGGVGGHIDKNTEENSVDPIADAMMRELKEEVIMQNYPRPKIIGYIKLNKGVEAVHFGIVAIGDTIEDVLPDQDMAQGRLYSVEEADEIIKNPLNNIETWTTASWPFVKDYLLKTNHVHTFKAHLL